MDYTPNSANPNGMESTSEGLAPLPNDYLPLANRWVVWDSRVLPAKRLTISLRRGVHGGYPLVAKLRTSQCTLRG
jgi:hypothetical protein